MNPYLGEIKLLPYVGNRVPRGWMVCDGSLLKIIQYQALFGLLGVKYGGDGQSTFALPDLRGKVAVGCNTIVNNSRILINVGEVKGKEKEVLAANQVPSHTHDLLGNSTKGATTPNPTNSVLAIAPAGKNTYGPMSNPPIEMHNSALGVSGVGQAHENMQPFLVLNYCIAVEGIQPERS